MQVGDHVTKGQTICIIEAMKLMNEIGGQGRLEGSERDGWSMEPRGGVLPGRMHPDLRAVSCGRAPACSCAARTSPLSALPAEAEATGTIVKILAENGDAVLPGQPLMLLKP